MLPSAGLQATTQYLISLAYDNVCYMFCKVFSGMVLPDPLFTIGWGEYEWVSNR